MKKLLLIASLLFFSAGIVQADNGMTKEQAASAIAASRPALAKKIEKMEARFNSTNTAKMQESADAVYDAIIEGMRLTHTLLNVEAPENRAAVNARYLQLEKSANQFHIYKADAAAHKDILLKAAQDFEQKY